MGQTICAVAGIGIIVNLDKIDDPREELYDFLSEACGDDEDGIVVLEIGTYADNPAYFIGSGAVTSSHDEITGDPIWRQPTSKVELGAKIKKLLSEIPCADGTWLTLFNERLFGFHVHPYVS